MAQVAQPTASKKYKRSRLITIVALLATLSLGGSFWLTTSVKPRETQAQSTIPVKVKDLALQFEVNGSVVPVSTVNISPDSTGRLVALYVDQGDRVTAGEILARMDASNLEAQLTQAKAELTQARAEYEHRARSATLH